MGHHRVGHDERRLTTNKSVTYCVTAIYPELLAVIKFGGWAPNRHCKHIGGFTWRLGNFTVGDHHMYMCKYEILADFNLAVAMQTAKLPNLIPCQFFQLYGTIAAPMPLVALFFWMWYLLDVVTNR